MSIKQNMDKRDPFSPNNIRDAVFLESPNCVVAYNLFPILPGHSLVIPKRSYSNIFEMPQDQFIEFMNLAKEATRLLCDAFGARDFNWTLQIGSAAGQTIEHLHMHLIPRSEGDLPHPGDWYPRLRAIELGIIDSPERPRLKPDEMQQIVLHLREIARDERGRRDAG
jgi:bis(5'-adenosyl)-triphosphatase